MATPTTDPPPSASTEMSPTRSTPRAPRRNAPPRAAAGNGPEPTGLGAAPRHDPGRLDASGCRGCRTDQPPDCRHQRRGRRGCAHGPNQVRVWDITLLPTTVNEHFHAMFVVMALHDRKIAAVAAHDTSDAAHAAALFPRASEEHEVAPETLTVHACMRRLAAEISHSQSGVSNDNPHIKSVFRSLKHDGLFLVRPFDTPRDVREWVETDVRGHNTEHLHRALHLVTPSQCHRGEDTKIPCLRRDAREGARKKTGGR